MKDAFFDGLVQLGEKIPRGLGGFFRLLVGDERKDFAGDCFEL